ncbi:MAG: FHA domain-containing protein [Burkholderiales bacterium]|nr:FHA domain-containing protein [Anaerolineae bacterium]
MPDQPPYEERGKTPTPPSHREPTRPRRPEQFLVPPAPVEQSEIPPEEIVVTTAPPDNPSAPEPAPAATGAPLATAPLNFPAGTPLDAELPTPQMDAGAAPSTLLELPPLPSTAEQPLQKEHDTLYFQRGMHPKKAAGDQPMTSTSQESGKSDKLKCPNCGHINRPGVLVCEKCFTLLKASSALSTKNLGPQPQAGANPVGSETLSSPLSTRDIKAVTGAGSNVLKDNTTLRFEVIGTTETIVLRPKPQMIIGRSDPAAGVKPEIDLTPLAGYRMGVSRRHATIQMRDSKLHLHDMGSCNGTSLNGETLTPYEAYALRDGDEIRVGQLTLRLYFLEDDSPNEVKS